MFYYQKVIVHTIRSVRPKHKVAGEQVKNRLHINVVHLKSIRNVAQQRRPLNDQTNDMELKAFYESISRALQLLPSFAYPQCVEFQRKFRATEMFHQIWEGQTAV